MEISQSTITTYKSDMVFSHEDEISALCSAWRIGYFLMAESQWNSRGHSKVCDDNEHAWRLENDIRQVAVTNTTFSGSTASVQLNRQCT